MVFFSSGERGRGCCSHCLHRIPFFSFFSIFTPSASASITSNHGLRSSAQVRDRSCPSRGGKGGPALTQSAQERAISSSRCSLRFRPSSRFREEATLLEPLHSTPSHSQPTGRASPRSPVSPRSLSARPHGVDRKRKSGGLAGEAGEEMNESSPFSFLVIQALRVFFSLPPSLSSTRPFPLVWSLPPQAHLSPFPPPR